ncbi:histidine phosphatase family protein [Streptomyces sp. NPDC091377]|uniref:histidine phosphatase family protein n=1 Tax=Streptomyces sp. NPDC091377 TaxID=3365995 RepID=UPI0037FC53C8
MHLYLMRHAQDRSRPAPGGGDRRRLTPTGRRQAAAAARWLARHEVTEIRTSCLPRARETAAVVAEGTRLACHEDARLDEIRTGPGGAGLPPPRERRDAVHPPDTEAWPDFLGRVRDCVADLCRRPDPGHRIVLVTHSGFFDALHELVAGGGDRMELQVDHAAITQWQYRPGCPAGAWLLHRHNHTPCPDGTVPARGPGGAA